VEVVARDGSKLLQTMPDKDDDTEIERGAAVPSTDDISTSHRIDHAVDHLKQTRVAIGEVGGMKIRTRVFMDVEDRERQWYIETVVTRVIEWGKEPRWDEFSPKRTTQKSLKSKFHSAGEAYIEFEGLIEKYDLEEITDPTKEVEYISE